MPTSAVSKYIRMIVSPMDNHGGTVACVAIAPDAHDRHSLDERVSW